VGALIPLVARLLGIETDVLLRRLKENAVAFTAIALFALIGLVFLLVAAYTALTWWVGPLWSPLIIAAAAFVIAIILYIALQIQQAALRRREEERKREAETTAVMAGAALSALPELFHNPLVRNVGLPVAIYAALLLFSSSPRPKRAAKTDSDHS